jgi:hypothetical protein
MPDNMPSGRECIYLFGRRLSNPILLHTLDLNIKSGLPVAIRRAGQADVDPRDLVARLTQEDEESRKGLDGRGE